MFVPAVAPRDRDQVAPCLTSAGAGAHPLSAWARVRRPRGLSRITRDARPAHRPAGENFTTAGIVLGHVHRPPLDLGEHARPRREAVKSACDPARGGAYASSSTAVRVERLPFAIGPLRSRTPAEAHASHNNPPCGAMPLVGPFRLCFAGEAQWTSAACWASSAIACATAAPGDVLPTGQKVMGSCRSPRDSNGRELPLPEPDPLPRCDPAARRGRHTTRATGCSAESASRSASEHLLGVFDDSARSFVLPPTEAGKGLRRPEVGQGVTNVISRWRARSWDGRRVLSPNYAPSAPPARRPRHG